MARETGAFPAVRTRLCLALLLALGCSAAAQAQTAVEYDCQVRTESGLDGLVTVQTADKLKASATARQSTARTTDGLRAQATEVVQCVNRRETRFSDLAFRQFVESLPR